VQHDFHAIPEAGERRDVGSMLARIYHDIGLAAVANALDLAAPDFDDEVATSIERGAFYLLPALSAAVVTERAA
jgi:hypothetical protein